MIELPIPRETAFKQWVVPVRPRGTDRYFRLVFSLETVPHANHREYLWRIHGQGFPTGVLAIHEPREFKVASSIADIRFGDRCELLGLNGNVCGVNTESNLVYVDVDQRRVLGPNPMLRGDKF